MVWEQKVRFPQLNHQNLGKTRGSQWEPPAAWMAATPLHGHQCRSGDCVELQADRWINIILMMTSMILIILMINLMVGNFHQEP